MTTREVLVSHDESQIPPGDSGLQFCPLCHSPLIKPEPVSANASNQLAAPVETNDAKDQATPGKQFFKPTSEKYEDQTY